MNLTPKKDFLEKKQFAEAHRELVVSTKFREAINAALIEQIMDMPAVTDPVAAAAAYHCIIGARGFITHLLNIAEQTKSAPTKPTNNLDHSVR